MTPYVVVYMQYTGSLCHTTGPMTRREALSKASKMKKTMELLSVNPAHYWPMYRVVEVMPQASAKAFCEKFERFDSVMCGGAAGWT